MLEPLLIGDIDASSAPAAVSSAGKSATTGGEQNIGLIIAILIVLLAIIAYFLLL
jgi:hypothetical protein